MCDELVTRSKESYWMCVYIFAAYNQQDATFHNLFISVRRKTRLNHVEHLTVMNKLWNFVSCWLYAANILATHVHMNVKKVCVYVCVCVCVCNCVWSRNHNSGVPRSELGCCTTHISCQILMNIEYSWQIFEKYSGIIFHKNPSSGNQDVPGGWPYRRTDGQTWRS